MITISKAVAVGILSRTVQTGLLFAFTHWLGFHYLISSLLAVAVVFTTNHVLNLRWVFNRPTRCNCQHGVYLNGA